MWVTKSLFDMIVADNKAQAERLGQVWNTCYSLQAKYDVVSNQKSKDDVTIDWMRHRINALEKQNAILMGKAAGIHFPVPEIVPSRPGTMTPPPDYDTMPSFEDLGDSEATRLGVAHDADGNVVFK